MGIAPAVRESLVQALRAKDSIQDDVVLPYLLPSRQACFRKMLPFLRKLPATGQAAPSFIGSNLGNSRCMMTRAPR